VPVSQLMTKLILLIPTKGRPNNYQRLKESFELNTHSDDNMRGPKMSSIMPVMDRFEAREYPGTGYLASKPDMNLVEKLNYAGAWAVKAQFKYIGFVGDDVVIQTPSFDKIICEEFEADPTLKIIHCADKMHNGQIANHWVIRADVIAAVGFFALPVCKHMFIDNFWTTVGTDTESIKYLDSVMWEHLHYMNKKSAMDATYEATNNSETFKHDEVAYNEFMGGEGLVNFLKAYNNV